MTTHRLNAKALISGSVASRLVEFFRDNPDEELTAADVCVKFGAPETDVFDLIEPALALRLVRCDSLRRRLDCRLSIGTPLMRSQFAQDIDQLLSLHQYLTDGDAPERQELPALDPDALLYEERDLTSGAWTTKPKRKPSLGTTKYDAIFARLVRPNQRVSLPISYQRAVQKAADLYCKSNPPCKLRCVPLNSAQVYLERVA